MICEVDTVCGFTAMQEKITPLPDTNKTSFVSGFLRRLRNNSICLNDFRFNFDINSCNSTEKLCSFHVQNACNLEKENEMVCHDGCYACSHCKCGVKSNDRIS